GALRLDAPVTRAARAAGLSDDEARRVSALALVLGRTFRARDAAAPLEQRLASLLDAPDAQAYLEVHTHDGVTWFAKERFDELAAAEEAASLVERATPPREWPTPDMKRASAAAASSGYRWPSLRALLAHRGPPPAPPSHPAR